MRRRGLVAALALAAVRGQDQTSVLDCACRPLAEDRIARYDQGPFKGKWYVRFPTCSSEAHAGPYASRDAAVADVPRLQAMSDFCFDRLTKAFEGESVPHADYVALQVELELTKARLGEVEHDLLQAQADNELLVNHYGIDTFRDHILEYLHHASASDDVLLGDDNDGDLVPSCLLHASKQRRATSSSKAPYVSLEGVREGLTDFGVAPGSSAYLYLGATLMERRECGKSDAE
eukprot:CAMPEP_0197428258 /NCGR_PEP_ID=MMETSP1170-20131217/40548_1 /TAXON_ID=54406 /ORGANISM="Sarcinochrysis sp, Strain CCMP770" /LENGTH=232 /DNA_ID=CAMNT_0042955997 /DNA_START=15 /DNA_END=712 /DNA_ORIENTATION=-